MGISYESQAFWSIIFSRTGSVVPRVLPNSILLLIWPAILCTIDEVYKLEDLGFGAEGLDPGIMSEWVGLLIGMMIAFRISDAYDKWRTANRLVLELHLHTRDLLLPCSVNLSHAVTKSRSGGVSITDAPPSLRASPAPLAGSAAAI